MADDGGGQPQAQEKSCTFFKKSGRRGGTRKRKTHPSADSGTARSSVSAFFVVRHLYTLYLINSYKIVLLLAGMC